MKFAATVLLAATLLPSIVHAIPILGDYEVNVTAYARGQGELSLDGSDPFYVNSGDAVTFSYVVDFDTPGTSDVPWATRYTDPLKSFTYSVAGRSISGSLGAGCSSMLIQNDTSSPMGLFDYYDVSLNDSCAGLGQFSFYITSFGGLNAPTALTTTDLLPPSDASQWIYDSCGPCEHTQVGLNTLYAVPTSITWATVPEPGSLALLAIGLAVFRAGARRRKVGPRLAERHS